MASLRNLFDRSLRLTALSSSDPGFFQERPANNGINEWLFVTPKESRGWILDAICREIGSRLNCSWDIAYNPNVLPEAKVYFFAHYWNYLDHMKKNPHILNGIVLVWYTHPREIPYSIPSQLAGYMKSTQMLFTCTEFLETWRERGLPAEKGRVVLGGADPKLFIGHRRDSGVVGLSSSFYERKNPDRLLELAKLLPHRKFRLAGRKWENYGQIDELLTLPNFEYLTCEYNHYPRIYSTFDTFVSLSILEGGPIPLLEAMMENAVPVASRTGFAPDLIQDGVNGFLFDVDAPASTIAELIERAATCRTNVRRSVLGYSWDNFAKTVHDLALRF